MPGTIPQALGALAVLLASVNVAGGFILTKRMLDMFKREQIPKNYSNIHLTSRLGPTDPPEYPWLYGVPAVVFTGGFLAAASTGMAGLVQAGYLTSSLLCIGKVGSLGTHALHGVHYVIGSLSGLASQTTARQGNTLGILGVGSGVLTTLGAVGFPVEVIAQFAGVAAMGGLIGTVVGRRVTATELPQTVALLHSIVGLSAVLTSVGSILADINHLSTLHMVTAYLGVVIGKGSHWVDILSKLMFGMKVVLLLPVHSLPS